MFGPKARVITRYAWRPEGTRNELALLGGLKARVTDHPALRLRTFFPIA